MKQPIENENKEFTLHHDASITTLDGEIGKELLRFDDGWTIGWKPLLEGRNFPRTPF